MDTILKLEEKDFISGYTTGSNTSTWTQRLINSYALIILLRGSCKISFDVNNVVAKDGDLILLIPGAKHSFHINSDTKLLWFHFMPRSHVIPMLKWPEKIQKVASVRLAPKEIISAKRELQEAYHLEQHRLQGWHPLACSLLETVIVRGYNHIKHKKTENIIDVKTIQVLLESNENIDIIAKKCAISRTSLYVKFKQATGFSPREYREIMVLRRASRILESSDLSIAEIAEQIGIPNEFYFSTRFKKYFGISPSKYRKNLL